MIMLLPLIVSVMEATRSNVKNKAKICRFSFDFSVDIFIFFHIITCSCCNHCSSVVTLIQIIIGEQKEKEQHELNKDQESFSRKLEIKS